jgi:acetylornithine deacetylase/succinyl-diaminopimelate desuccinylase-like protein
LVDEAANVIGQSKPHWENTMITLRIFGLCIVLVAAFSLAAFSQAVPQVDWKTAEAEILRHFQAVVQVNSADPGGSEKPVADYLLQLFEKEGIPAKLLASDPKRPNVVARLKGNGKKRPILLMGHSDTVSIDAAKWSFPPFGATRDNGWIYGRGTVDDKDNLVSSLTVMLLLKRLNVPLDRDVIFLSEAGEEGASRLGVQFVADNHFDEINAEYCLAEGGNGTRVDGKVKFISIQTVEKIPRGMTLTATGISGHGSVPLRTNPVVHLARAVAAIADWKPPVRLNDTTGTYFQRLAEISTGDQAKFYRDILSPDAKKADAADEYFLDNEPRHGSMVRTSISPNIFNGGYRSNVIPSEAKATLDVRALPDEDPVKFLDAVRKVVNDPAVKVDYSGQSSRPGTPVGSLTSEAFKTLEANVKKHYEVVTLPAMGTGATDMSYLRRKGIECYGIGPALDLEDTAKGFGAHSDQERIVESELYRFVRFNWDVVLDLARAR